MIYTVGGLLTLLYQDPNIGLASIRWTINKVENGDANTLIEYLNPVDASDVFVHLGSGAYIFSCFYRHGPITVVGDINLNLKGTDILECTYSIYIYIHTEKFAFTLLIHILIRTFRYTIYQAECGHILYTSALYALA